MGAEGVSQWLVEGKLSPADEANGSARRHYLVIMLWQVLDLLVIKTMFSFCAYYTGSFHKKLSFWVSSLSYRFTLNLLEKFLKSFLLYSNFCFIEEFHREQTMHFIALKRQTFLSFLEYRVLTSSFLGFRAKATRVSYKPVSYKKYREFVHPEPLHDMIIKNIFVILSTSFSLVNSN